MTVYYYGRKWHTGAPHDKKVKVVECDLPKPRYRPGQWVKFTDETVCPRISEMVGRIEYVKVTVDGEKKKSFYEIQHGYTYHTATNKTIICRMVPEETEE